jgi:hypothetical protein
MAEPFERHTISLVVRLWVEPLQEQGEARWRGQIVDIASGETTHFQVPSALIDYLVTHVSSAARVAGDVGLAPPPGNSK